MILRASHETLPLTALAPEHQRHVLARRPPPNETLRLAALTVLREGSAASMWASSMLPAPKLLWHVCMQSAVRSLRSTMQALMETLDEIPQPCTVGQCAQANGKHALQQNEVQYLFG